VSTPEFENDHPSAPPRIRQLSAPELKAMIDGGRPFELFDVRTEDERAMAMIEGSRLLDQKGYDYLLTLDRDTPVVFQCHHGIRSQSAAEYCLREQGFRNLYNLEGGIDAWSRLVDPSVPRY
jgi:monothiol glutaredoxin